jgi:outer membrane scaffolding protein for murein synthesis (MipA/OmpV family)
MEFRFLFVAAAGFLAQGLFGELQAEELPRWELGIGVGGLYLSDYRGANERHGYLLPLPYGVYRGDKVSVDREGLRGKVFGSERVTLLLSVTGDLPVNSDKNQARAGMPDLDPTIEVGPSLEIQLWKGQAKQRLSLNLPLRTVIATDLSHFKNIGWVFAPHFDLKLPVFGTHDDSFIQFTSGPLYAGKKYHDYYYAVDPVFRTAERDVYAARGGYSGSYFTVGISWRLGDIWLGGFAGYDDLSGAVFADSPLVKDKKSLIVGGGIAYIFAKSQYKTNVP